VENHSFRISADFEGPLVFLHLVVKQFSKDIYKIGKRGFWPYVLRQLAKRGYTEVYATPYENDLRAQKLIRSFGFHERGVSNGLMVMNRRIENG